MNNKGDRSPLTKRVGHNIKLWRLLRNMKQDQLAKQLGITKSALSQLETGSVNISLKRIEEIAELLGISEKDLLFFND